MGENVPVAPPTTQVDSRQQVGEIDSPLPILAEVGETFGALDDRQPGSPLPTQVDKETAGSGKSKRELGYVVKKLR